MPVIQLSLSNLGRYCKKKVDERKIIDTLPYLGLDIEDRDGDLLSVEYSPNRPDFSSEAGIARSLVGLLAIKTGLPKYKFRQSKYEITVAGTEIVRARPYVHAMYAEFSLTDKTIRQLISMQEDLHNGIGRKRSKVAIGIHNAEVISDQIKYYATTDRTFSFAPLGSEERQTIDQILASTEQGRVYGRLVGGVFPILEDSKGNVLSMPPIVNGNLTRLNPGQNKLFVDITGTDEPSVETTAAIIASMISDSGGHVYSVGIRHGKARFATPEMRHKTMRFDLKLTNAILGYEFTAKQAKSYLARSRIGMLSHSKVAIPRYRHDIIHPIDLAEETALGYGIPRFTPSETSSDCVGSFSPRQKWLDLVVEAMVGLGFTEMWNLSLTNSRHTSEKSLKVEDSKSQNFEYLRDVLVWTLLDTLGNCTHQEYPQRIFEQGPVFKYSPEHSTQVDEEEHVAGLVADSEVTYSMIRSNVDALLNSFKEKGNGFSFSPTTRDIGPFARGRSAAISVLKTSGVFEIGVVGEVHPSYLEKYGLKLPAAGFELNLEILLKD